MSKKYTVVDAEFHHIPLEAAKQAGRTAKGEIDFSVRVKSANPTFRRIFDIESSLRHMEESGVDMALIGLATWAEPGLEVCRAINDGLAKVVKDYPGKFIPLAHVPYLEGRSALDELTRAVNELGLKGVTMMTSLQDIRLDDKQLKPFFKKVRELRIPIMVHPNVKMPIWGGTKYYMSGSVSREYDVCKAAVEVMYGVLKEFPDLKFIIPHHGGGLASLLGRVIAWFEPDQWNIPEDIKGLPKTPRELEQLGIDVEFRKIFDNLYFDTAGFGGWMPITESTVKVVRADRLCFGTDYPFEIHEMQ